MYLDIIARPFRIKLVAGIVLFLLIVILINAAIFYYQTDYELGEGYVEKILKASQAKTQIIKNAFAIYGVFALLCLVGVIAALIFNTHRV
ncbi:MAG TPA: hypothetical protein VN328_01670, partial [Thermodesulfovibrionales bacterium]|nr:hypothetical protein [Thermodesulfovibrionales bacterium]